jgi:hypothetical protein
MSFSLGIKPVFPIAIGGTSYLIYIGILAGALNLAVAFVASFLFKSLGAKDGKDVTVAGDYVVSKSA